MDAFGNALGQSIAEGSSGAQPPALTTGDFSRLERTSGTYDGASVRLFDGSMIGEAENLRRIQFHGDVYASNDLVEPGAPRVMSDAGSSPHSVTVTGTGWSGDFQLEDGTWVLKASDPNDLRRMIANLPINTASPLVPGYSLDWERSFARLGTKDAYYTAASTLAITPSVDSQQVNLPTTQTFQDINDQRVIAGTYDRFNEIRQAWSSGAWGDVWRHFNFVASPQARNVAVERIFPPEQSDAIRLQRMATSPIGTVASTFGRFFGADQSRQDALLMTGSLLEQFGGVRSHVYKQTLTAPPPPLSTQARARGLGQPARALPGVTPEVKRGVVEFHGLEVRAVRDLTHVDVSTLRAMQKYGFAATDGAGNSLILHHHRQNPAGPIIEMPAGNHSVGKPAQHPFGNAKGSGLTPQERAEFDQWRVDYWKWRATQELQTRGLE
jgi:hypothetical protein